MVPADTQQYITAARRAKAFRRRLAAVGPILSLLVIAGVFWWLKLVGITLAGEAFCGKEEHAHGAACALQKTLLCDAAHEHTDACYETAYSCGLEEHIHLSACYSDITADVETAADWEASLAEVPTGLTKGQTVAAVARSQLGYAESERNFVVEDGVQRGYTRYGEWFGNPYGDWATMFTSFCLRYGGLPDAPVSAGAETLRLKWEEAGRYYPAAQYLPLAGDVLFLDKNGNGTAETTAVVTGVSEGTVSVIEGDLDGRVAEAAYPLAGSAVVGFGASVPGNNLLMLNTAAAESAPIAQTVAYDPALFVETNSFVVYTASGGSYYAFDGNGNAVQIYIDGNGQITADVEDADLLLWSFTPSGEDDYVIQNSRTGRYMHAYPNNGTGVTTGGAYSSTLVAQNGDGVKIRSNTEYARLVVADGNFQMTQNQSLAAVYQFGVVNRCTLWLDGTNGGLMGLGGSLNQSYTVPGGQTVRLPDEWQSPGKYSYRLQGWYDVKNQRHYLPGTEITVTENLVFYADWVAATYDIGQFNSLVADTVSTRDFITTGVFDYNSLFNLLSTSATVSANASGHTETWQLISNGTVPYRGGDTLNFIFSDYDSDGDISYPNNRNGANVSGGVYSGLYTDALGHILFDTGNAFDPVSGTGIPGKQYLGTADHLFQLDGDPASEHYGYYYYDSRLNAASYNQSDNRFYVYDYLERTADSEKDGGVGEYSDFLPFNSPYANTNGQDTVTYTYEGLQGEYAGVDHYQYDAKYTSGNNATDHVTTNYWFGMRIDLRFYLPDAPGSRDADGEYGNRDLYGKEKHFKFSGDDDVWVLVDGQLVLDLGGIHGVQSGDINFSTGVVTVNGVQTGTILELGEGEHTLTMCYLERGSSQSNCAIYFNLSPRFGLDIQKEDTLTGEVLTGAQFSVYTDKQCSTPAQLWESEAAYNDRQPATNVFTVTDGMASLWGLSAGKTYYIRETKPPDAAAYSCARGIICLSLDRQGTASYSVEIIQETDENGDPVDISDGFTVYGFRIDEETQQAFLVITNAQDWVTETTTVQVMKEWNDTADHTYDTVTVYLTVTDPDGTVRRIREITLGEENNWTYVWDGLPKYARDGVTEIRYGVEEAYKSGYEPSVEKLEELVSTNETWTEVRSFLQDGVYILGTDSGYLSTTSASADTLCWVDVQTAKASPLALWTATLSGNDLRLTNAAGQILSFNPSGSRYFYAASGSASYQTLVPVDAGAGIRLYCTRSNRSYYIGSIGSNGRAAATTNANSALTFVPMMRSTETTVQEIEGFAFRITNTPLKEETSLKVIKTWDVGMATNTDHQQAQVTVKLLANGKDTGRTVTLSLKNGWQDTFLGLPYTDDTGQVIVYSVEESWDTDDWVPSYSELRQTDGDIPTYEITVTNTYRWGHGYELPSTGGPGRSIWILSGLFILLGALAGGCIWRRKQKRRLRP